MPHLTALKMGYTVLTAKQLPAFLQRLPPTLETLSFCNASLLMKESVVPWIPLQLKQVWFNVGDCRTVKQAEIMSNHFRQMTELEVVTLSLNLSLLPADEKEQEEVVMMWLNMLASLNKLKYWSLNQRYQPLAVKLIEQRQIWQLARVIHPLAGENEFKKQISLVDYLQRARSTTGDYLPLKDTGYDQHTLIAMQKATYF